MEHEGLPALCSTFHADKKKREEGENKNHLSLSSTSFRFRPIPKTDNADRKTNRKSAFYENHRDEDEKFDCMCGHTGKHVYFEGREVVFCFRTRA